MIRFSRLPRVSLQTLGELSSFFNIALATVAPDGNTLTLNAKWRAWAGDAEADWRKPFHSGGCRPLELELEEAKRSGSAAFECAFARADGVAMWVHLQIFRMTAAGGRMEGYVVGASDMSALHRMTSRFEAAALSTIESLSAMEAARDLYTAGHHDRVGRLAEAIGGALGMTEVELTGLRIAALLHDAGKVATPIEILTKPALLTPGEMAVIREHAANGYAILRNVTADWPVARVAHEHHERLDGSGYPRGLKGDAILLEARITAVADVVESMAVDRPYRRTSGVGAALDEIRRNSGRWYDPDAVDACVKLVENGFDVTAERGASGS